MKLSNGIEYQNQHFDEAFGEYLLSNNFNCSAVKDDLHFTVADKQLIVRNDNIDLFLFRPESSQHDEKWVFAQCHAGIGKMDVFKWMLLMHSMDVVGLHEFLRNARARDKQHFTEAMLMVKSVLLTGTSMVKAALVIALVFIASLVNAQEVISGHVKAIRNDTVWLDDSTSFVINLRKIKQAPKVGDRISFTGVSRMGRNRFKVNAKKLD